MRRASVACSRPFSSFTVVIDGPPFTIGIEEEYLVVDRETRDLINEPSPGIVGLAA